MGLIKLAIISGVAVYGVNKMAKHNESKRRGDQPNRTDNYYRDGSQPLYKDAGMTDNRYPDYYAPPSQGQTYQEKEQPRELNFVGRRSYPSDYAHDRGHNEKSGHHQQPVYLQNDPFSPLPGSRGQEDNVRSGYDDGPALPPQYDEYRPRYQSQRYPRTGFVEPDEVSESDLQSRNGNATARQGSGRGTGSSMMNGLADLLNGDRTKDLKRMFAK
ncbi:hypothetical protein PV08_01562 [Exophiala spinifera]|uniref:Uncharacterized protein n=1 Tax=Exophiala spinifera TaxID=91928 RepID=A0A0D2BPV8_9EURO|nr:uncharacterized protein PV08_01562 [Exophiala spinifera]KIW20983.1 hypothetical protein PV08_01562 [Exophiala spinifera]